MFPRASWTNLLASSPMVVVSAASSATAIQNLRVATFADGTATGVLGVNPMFFDSTNYNRFLSADQVGDSVAGGRNLPIAPWVWNATNWSRMLNTTGADASAAAGLLGVGLVAWGGDTNYLRLYTGSAQNLSAATTNRPLMVQQMGEWTLQNEAAAGSASTATRAAGATGVRHILKSLLVAVNVTANAATTINVRDGGSGAGTVLWSITVRVLANDSKIVQMSNLNIIGSTATAMTVEQSAGVASLQASINASGISVAGG